MIIEDKPLNKAYVIIQMEDILFWKELCEEIKIAIKIYKKTNHNVSISCKEVK